MIDKIRLYQIIWWVGYACIPVGLYLGLEWLSAFPKLYKVFAIILVGLAMCVWADKRIEKEQNGRAKNRASHKA